MSDDVGRKLTKMFGRYKTSSGKNGREYVVDCPECDGKSKLYININKGAYVCFKCGYTGSSARLLGLSDRITFKPKERKPIRTDIQMPGELQELTHLEEDNPALLYLGQRGFDHKELNDVYGVRYCYYGRSYADGLFNTTNTLVFPLWMHGKLVGWQARLLYDVDELTDEEMGLLGFKQDDDGDYITPPKYWTSPGLEKGRLLYNYDWAKANDVVVVTEGVFDSLAVGKPGVATLGKRVSEAQIQMLINWPLVVLLLDPDAYDDAVALKYEIEKSTIVLLIRLEGYKDAGEAPRMALWQQIAEEAARCGVNLNKLKIQL